MKQLILVLLSLALFISCARVQMPFNNRVPNFTMLEDGDFLSQRPNAKYFYGIYQTPEGDMLMPVRVAIKKEKYVDEYLSIKNDTFEVERLRITSRKDTAQFIIAMNYKLKSGLLGHFYNTVTDPDVRNKKLVDYPELQPVYPKTNRSVDVSLQFQGDLDRDGGEDVILQTCKDEGCTYYILLSSLAKTGMRYGLATTRFEQNQD